MRLFYGNDIRVDQSALLLAQQAALEAGEAGEAKFAPYQPFPSRVSAQSANIPAGVQYLNVNGLQYVRDPTGTALSTADGATWSPLGDAVPEHFGIIGDVRIPTDFPNLQSAVDMFGEARTEPIVILIESGHALTSGLYVENGDYSKISISSEDASVSLASGFSGTIIKAVSAALPRLACLINAANQVSGNGVEIYDRSSMTVDPGCGVSNSWATGLLARYASTVNANQSVWTGSARNGATGAGITAWGATIDAQGADVSGSGYYGCQAAHSGNVNFRDGLANNCYRHGIRATDGGAMNATGAQANNCAQSGSGYAVYAYQAGIVNFEGGSATDSGYIGIMAYASSTINADGAIVSDAAIADVAAHRNSFINFVGGSAASYSIKDSRVIFFETGIQGPERKRQSAVISSGVASIVPSASGRNFLQSDTESGAASDDLDALTPASGYEFNLGDLVTIKAASSGREVVIRDATTSGVTFGSFQIPGNSSITLNNSSLTATFIWNDPYWLAI